MSSTGLLPPLALPWNVWGSALPAPGLGCPPHSPRPGTPVPCPCMVGEPWTVTATSCFCITCGVFQEPPVPQEGPGGAFWGPSLLSIQGKAGRAPAGRSRRQPHPSQTASPAVLTSMVFLTSYPEGLANWVSSHRPRGIPQCSDHLIASVSSLVPSLNSSFLLPVLSHRSRLYTTEPFSRHSDS